MPIDQRLLLVSLLLTHSLSLAVWIGVMLFNLIVNFPAQRARARSVGELTSAMGAQARRAAPWLYLLMGLVALSGLGLQHLLPGALGAHASALAWAKWSALGSMALLHAWGSWVLWPRIYFALDSERPALFLQYQLAMAASAALGIAATAASFWARWP
jgi:hypothetical protein